MSVQHSCPLIDNIIYLARRLTEMAAEEHSARAIKLMMQIECDAEDVRSINRDLREERDVANFQIKDLYDTIDADKRTIDGLVREIENLREYANSLEEIYELR